MCSPLCGRAECVCLPRCADVWCECRGYSSIKETQFSHLNVRVRQMDEQAAAAVTLRRRPRLVAPIMQRLQDRQARTPRRLRVKTQGGSSSGSRQQMQQA